MNSGPKVREVIDQRHVSPLQVSVFLLCGLVLVLDGFDTQSIGFLAPAIAESLHISIKTLGPVFAAALFGLMVSSLSAGPIADRVGRKWPIILSTFTFATFTLVSTQATSLRQLELFRFLTGLGLGGALPNVIAMTSEYSPKRLRQVLITVISCGMPLGALTGGLVSSAMLPAWGWKSVFYAGGILPLVVALILIRSLPESILFLGIRNNGHERAARILARIAPDLVSASINYSSDSAPNRSRIPVLALFLEGRASRTLLLWVAVFMNLLVLYFIVSWLPALLRQAAAPVSWGIAAISLFSLGGIAGSLLQGKGMVRWGDRNTLLAEFAISAVLMGVLAYSSKMAAIMLTTFFLGIFVQGAQAGLNALSARSYPVSMRATGVGWALGVGRVGSIVGPLLGGFMLGKGWSTQQVLFAGGVPALVATLSMVAGKRIHSSHEPSELTGDAEAYPNH